MAIKSLVCEKSGKLATFTAAISNPVKTITIAKASTDTGLESVSTENKVVYVVLNDARTQAQSGII